MLSYRAPSFGKFSTKLNTQYWFGTPRNVSMAGLQMDVDKYAIAVNDKNNQTANAVNYMQVIGSRGSAMEHLVPEQMFSTPEAPAQGISAVKALAIASAQGQKIWTITQNNLDIAMAALQLDVDSKAEIRAGVLAGNVVTAHEKPINFNGWVGEGYTIIDPQTGAGAYKIAGGGNGGELLVAGVAILGIGAIAYQGMLIGAAINPIFIAIALAIAIHIIVLELIFNHENIRWDDVKGQITFILGAIVGGVPNSLGSAIRTILSYLIGLSGFL